MYLKNKLKVGIYTALSKVKFPQRDIKKVKKKIARKPYNNDQTPPRPFSRPTTVYSQLFEIYCMSLPVSL